MQHNNYDAVIIGGGFFGLSVGLYLKEQIGLKKVIILEQGNDLMKRASYNNQARVHNGYHYPRSMLTALRSRINFPRFIADYDYAIVSNFKKYYAVPKNFSFVSAGQYKLFCERIGAYITKAPDDVNKLFNKQLIKDVFLVKEYAFSAKLLRTGLVKKLSRAGVEVIINTEVHSVKKTPNGLMVKNKDGKTIGASKVFNCTYSSINKINSNSGIPLIPLKHELTEMCLVKMPPALKDVSVTVMCGPFFSFMPFPDKNLYTLSHVRYTPHSEWFDNDKYERDGLNYLDKEIKKVSHFPQMIRDVQRYIPAMKDAIYKGSIWEIKTVLPQSESDDSRPILFKSDYEIPNYTCLMGGKIDNIYDVFRELDILYGKE